MQPVAKYYKDPSERKRYKLDYSAWLDAGETIANVTFTVKGPNLTAPLVIDDIQILSSAVLVQYYISGGAKDVTYQILATATTSGSQIKEDLILMVVREN